MWAHKMNERTNGSSHMREKSVNPFFVANGNFAWNRLLLSTLNHFDMSSSIYPWYYAIDLERVKRGPLAYAYPSVPQCFSNRNFLTKMNKHIETKTRNNKIIKLITLLFVARLWQHEMKFGTQVLLKYLYLDLGILVFIRTNKKRVCTSWRDPSNNMWEYQWQYIGMFCNEKRYFPSHWHI